jgi:hypothetical protein
MGAAAVGGLGERGGCRGDDEGGGEQGLHDGTPEVCDVSVER